MRSDNFVQKINSYFYSISAPIVIVIDSFQDVLKVNKAEILEFLKHLSTLGKIKIVLISRTFESENIDGVFDYKKVLFGALEKSLYEKFLNSDGTLNSNVSLSLCHFKKR